MARAIDKRIMLDLIIEAKKTDPEAGPFSEWLAEYLVDHLPTLTPPNEWVSVEERLPEYNPGTGAKSYWVAKKDNAGNWQMKIAQYCDYGYAMTVDAETEVTWRDWDFTKIANVTHWMLLPAPPDRRPPEGDCEIKDYAETCEDCRFCDNTPASPPEGEEGDADCG